MLTAEHLRQKQRLLRGVRRVVVKVGSSIVSGKGGLNRRRLTSFVRELVALRERGISVLVVTSGAVAAGVARLEMKQRPKTLPQRQAAAAVGQIHLMAVYERLFARHDVAVAQLLLTHDDLADRRRYLNARHTIETLFKAGVVPVANENDTVVTAELTNFGDNDNLSALIAGVVEADLLVLLSDVPGLYTKNPAEHADAELIALVDEAGADVSMEGRSTVGTGGMASKYAAAMKAAAAGIPTVIGDGLHSGVLPRIFDARVAEGTLFVPRGDRMSRRKHWIAYTLKPSGTLTLDDGAVSAVRDKGRSLLPSGVTAVDGRFESGACVRCVTAGGDEIARGITNYSSAELERIQGLHSSKIASVLGDRVAVEVVHRDDLVVLTPVTTR